MKRAKTKKACVLTLCMIVGVVLVFVSAPEGKAPPKRILMGLNQDITGFMAPVGRTHTDAC